MLLGVLEGLQQHWPSLLQRMSAGHISATHLHSMNKALVELANRIHEAAEAGGKASSDMRAAIGGATSSDGRLSLRFLCWPTAVNTLTCF